MPHGMCYLWDAALLGAHVGADALIALAYFSIPAFLLWLVRRRSDLPFSKILILFALFIVSCGTTHLFSIWVIWHPDYWVEAADKWATAVFSIATVAALVPLAPSLLNFQSRKQALEALAESEARLQTFLCAVPQIVWTADATGSIDWYNGQWYEYTGQTAEEAAGWGWQAAHHPEDIALVMSKWPHSIATGEAFEMEFRLRRYDGEFQWFLTRVLPQFDAQGAVVRWYGSNTNIDAQRKALERSARIAGTLQEAFLPARLPNHSRLRFDAVYLPAERDALVGGDWYDAMTLPSGNVLISCGDVAGHGLDAAVLAGRFRQSIAVAAFEDCEPASILSRVNRIATLHDDGMATAVVAVLDPVTLRLAYAVAGHPPPALALAAGPAHLLLNGGLPLGVMEDAGWTTQTVTLDDGAVVVFYTDGVTEFARDIIAAEEALVVAAAALASGRNVASPARAIKDFVMRKTLPLDDAAILVLQCAPEAPAQASVDTTQLVKTWRFHSSNARTAHQYRQTLMTYVQALSCAEDELFPTELILGEAIANTVAHAPGLVEVTIDWTRERPIVTVRDAGPAFALERPRLPSDPLCEHGRGMFLIDSFAADISVRQAGAGTELRFTLPVRRRVPESDPPPGLIVKQPQ